MAKGCDYKTQCGSYRFHASPGDLANSRAMKKSCSDSLVYAGRYQLAPHLLSFVLDKNQMSRRVEPTVFAPSWLRLVAKQAGFGCCGNT
jgi:hypothetical protein